jgi:DNA processing protein
LGKNSIFGYSYTLPMPDESICRIALTLIPQIGPVHARTLINHFGTATAIFKAKEKQLEKIEGIGAARANQITGFANFNLAETEMLFVEKYKIEPLFITDKKYPQRLLNCYDPPTLLYYRGNADLNAHKIISIVGTRSHSDYGKQVTEKIIKELSAQNILIVSGLALGIDAIAHKSSLKNNLSTIAVMAHGMDKIYPPEHAPLAKEIVKQGGLLTEFTSGTDPDKHNFPTRNRIVAGMSDATLVIETGVKGGSMITAELANSYHKDIFAIPGKTIDHKSAGCNYLIKTNKAILLTDTQQLLEAMGWEEKQQKKSRRQRTLFVELTEDEKIIVDLLQTKATMGIDELTLKSNLSSSAVAAAILNLELQNSIQVLPGKMYALC